ncbi:hypothetical protein ACA910_002728 [Epithemia clementina (nom. ined.)]
MIPESIRGATSSRNVDERMAHSCMSDEENAGSFLMIDSLESEPERTIHAMEKSGICAQSRHYHSFQSTSLMLTVLRKCIACEKRIQSVIFPSSDTSKQIVKCVACGAYAHRVCTGDQHLQWKHTCPVNKHQIESAISYYPGDHRTHQMGKGKACQVTGNLNLECSEKEGKGVKEEAVTEECVMSMEWTTKGPPDHWATGDPKDMIPTITIPSSSDDVDCDNPDEVHVTLLHHADHPFASVSRALQENILAHFRSNYKRVETSEKEKSSGVISDDTRTEVAQALSEEAKTSQRSEDENKDSPNTLAKLASGTLQAVRTSVSLPARLGMATVAGGIAGGVAGLALAGPAGAYAGYKLGQTAGVLGVILEGSVSVGVVVASVATASYTAKQIQEHLSERRVLTMGEEGTSRKVLLVRPSVQVDPAWEKIFQEAKNNAPNQRGTFFLLSDDNAAARERYHRDSDIVRPSEDEIPTTDKVLLLASRILNDKNSLPGHIYRSLVGTFEERCAADAFAPDGEPSRRRRDDAHAVIKHVTTALLEERPGFGHTAALTELTATAVEGFVFGQIYNVVFEEIQREVSPKDVDLSEKIADFEISQPELCDQNDVFEDALDALRLVPTFSTAVEKLKCCTTFLERISGHFAKTGDNAAISADSLLKMVCQHVVAIKLEAINAEIAFVEEFARDEQLLRGREGYALATLQAALHFLNMSVNLENDIFKQDDEEKNVPIHECSTSERFRNGTTAGSTTSLESSVELL